MISAGVFIYLFIYFWILEILKYLYFLLAHCIIIFNKKLFFKIINKCQTDILECAIPSSHVCDFYLLNIHVGFWIFSCRAINNFKSYFNKRINYISNIMSKRHHVFTESCTILFFKYSKNWELTRNSKLRDFRRSPFGYYIHVIFIK